MKLYFIHKMFLKSSSFWGLPRLVSSTISAMSLQEQGLLQIFKLCLHHNLDECCMLWRWGWLWYGGCWCWQRSWIVDQTKSNQIKSVRLCWQMRGGDVWRMLWRGDNSHRSVADTFSQIFTILSHVFSRIYSLAHTYQTQAHTYKTHTTYKKLTQTSTDTNYQFYFQCDWVWLFLKYTLWLIQRHKHT